MAAFSAAPFIGPTIGTFPHLVSPGSSRFAALEKMEGVKEVETGSIARWERGGGREKEESIPVEMVVSMYGKGR